METLSNSKETPRTLYIMRGMSGSGKSTKARELAGDVGEIYSTDDLFMKNGEYIFDPQQLPQNHKRNQDLVWNALSRGVPIVIVDNTNIRPQDYEPYKLMAQKAGYNVKIIEMPDIDLAEATRRNVHGVSESTIAKQMRDKGSYQEI